MLYKVSPNKNQKLVKSVLWVVLILSPILSGLVIGVLTGTSIFNLDGFNTTWNDEVGYYRAIITIREIGVPSGFCGYEEVPAKLTAYGAYNYLTYLPYYLLSYITGITSHNFVVFSNLIMVATSLAIYVFLVRPDINKTVKIILFIAFHVFVGRYIWSGMSEGIFISGSIGITSLILYINKQNNHNEKRKRTAMLFLCMLIIYLGLLRPFLLAYILFPAWFVISDVNIKRKEKVLIIIGLGVICIVSIVLFFWMSNNICAPYINGLSYLHNCKSAREAIAQIVGNNVIALKSIVKAVVNNNIFGCVGIELFCLCSLFLIKAIQLAVHYKTVIQKDVLGCLSLFIIAICVYEANIIAYSPNLQVMRMEMPVMISLALVYTEFNNTRFIGMCKEVILMTVLCFSIANGNAAEFLTIPQVNSGGNSENDIGNSISLIIRDGYEKWDNTIVVPAYDLEDLSVQFKLPSYLSINFCTDSYIYESVLNNTLKSKYIILKDGTELSDLCKDSYKTVWSQNELSIFESR